MKYSILTLLLFLPVVTFAQYQSLVEIPLPGGGTATSLNDYVNAIYALSISIAALLAVIKITIAGVKWMTTDIVTTKGEAKKDIQGALLGLLLILAAALIINIINPKIAEVNLEFGSFTVPDNTANDDYAIYSAIDLCNQSTRTCQVFSCETVVNGERVFDCDVVSEEKCSDGQAFNQDDRYITCTAQGNITESECVSNTSCDVVVCNWAATSIGCNATMDTCWAAGNIVGEVIEGTSFFTSDSITCIEPSDTRDPAIKIRECIDDANCTALDCPMASTATPANPIRNCFPAIEKCEDEYNGTYEPGDNTTILCKTT